MPPRVLHLPRLSLWGVGFWLWKRVFQGLGIGFRKILGENFWIVVEKTFVVDVLTGVVDRC